MNQWLEDAIEFYFYSPEIEVGDEYLDLSDQEKLELIWDFIKYEKARDEQLKRIRPAGLSDFPAP